MAQWRAATLTRRTDTRATPSGSPLCLFYRLYTKLDRRINPFRLRHQLPTFRSRVRHGVLGFPSTADTRVIPKGDPPDWTPHGA